MTIVEMLGQSGVLTVLGMGVVFGFLIIMIICISLAGKVIHALGWDADVRGPAGSGAPAGKAPAGGAAKTAVTAAITAAVTEYRKTNS
ncbi:MAG: OadG family protein [Spirochaetaceae bacterium]|jgi:oxaloacetate decarboxylase gamma subunit|nr:OadG family protein [Spirochaetaceae bacterium]